MTHGHEHHAPHDQHAFDEELAEMLDLDAEVLADHLAGTVDWAVRVAGPVRRVLDLGAGTGTGTFALLDRCPEASAVALDSSAPMLRRLSHAAAERGLADRVRTVEADLDAAPLPDVGQVDLAWASASLHHLAEVDRVLADVHAALRPGGVLAVLELDGMPRFLPGSAMEERVHAALSAARQHDLPLLGDDWRGRLTRVGFTVEDERLFDIALDPPLPPAALAYARVTLTRIRARLADRLAPADLAELDAVLAGDLAGEDVRVRTVRTGLLARRAV